MLSNHTDNTADENTTIPQPSFLAGAMQIAMQTFRNGKKENEAFKQKITADPQLAQQIHEEDLMGLQMPMFATVCKPQFKDPHFPNYNANFIAGTHFIAAAGPARSPQDVAQFFYNIAFNEKLDTPVREIVAFGNYLRSVHGGGGQSDFVDYITASDQSQVIYTPWHKPGEKPAYTIQADYLAVKNTLVTAPSGQRHAKNNSLPTEAKIKLTLLTDDQQQPKSVELHVTFHSLVDNTPLDLSHSSDETKEVFWQHYQKYLQDIMLAHCAGGVGRTGHFILMLELLKNFDHVFANTTEAQAAERILEIITRIRSTRPGLVWTDDQFTQAIQNAVVLRQYALTKGYLHQAGIQSEAPTSRSHSLSAASTTTSRSISSQASEQSSASMEEEPALERTIFARAAAIEKRVTLKLSEQSSPLKDSLPTLLQILKTYKVHREYRADKHYGHFFNCLKYSRQDKLHAVQFLIDILENKTPLSGTLDQHMGALRQGSLGVAIRNIAQQNKMGTVSNLVKTVYQDYTKKQATVDREAAHHNSLVRRNT